jgi:ribosomal-protein-alanine N-acetyltransferase
MLASVPLGMPLLPAAPAQGVARALPVCGWIAFSPAWLEVVMQVEQSAYGHPWTRGHFLDAFKAGYAMRLLVAAQADEQPVESSCLIGYWVGMPGFEEVHLLNVCVAPPWQRRGVAQALLSDLKRWAQAVQAQSIWLEARVSNERALAAYDRAGFVCVGRRKDYYPSARNQREDALVMQWRVEGAASESLKDDQP